MHTCQGDHESTITEGSPFYIKRLARLCPDPGKATQQLTKLLQTLDKKVFRLMEELFDLRPSNEVGVLYLQHGRMRLSNPSFFKSYRMDCVYLFFCAL